MTRRVGILGARGYVGGELIRLLSGHPELELAAVSSRELAGRRVKETVPSHSGELVYESLGPEDLAGRSLDVWILALPNGAAAPYVAALDAAQPDVVIVDVSADYRFDAAWYYGLPELFRKHAAGQRRISNPGCYATGMQLALAPLSDVLAGPPVCFGVSGYSGAGTTPSPRNDPARLAENLMPYSLVDHLHEREVSRHLGAPIHFMPHVAAFFRGLTITADVMLTRPLDRGAVMDRFLSCYAGEPFVDVQDEAPTVKDAAGTNRAVVGGFVVGEGGRRVVVVSSLDNLLKGAATQAVQNVNLALGLPEATGLEP
jgi:N-acetyl-gamma-glutamyl-phosphate reductase